MRKALAVLVCLLMSLGTVAADEKKPSKEPAKQLIEEQAADAVLAALKANDKAALKALAETKRPDVWLVADELLSRSEQDAAKALAQSVSGKEGEALVAYLAARRDKAYETDARRSFDAVQAHLRAGRGSQALDAIEKAKVTPGTVLALRLGLGRGMAFRVLRRSDESVAALLAVADAIKKLGWSFAQATALREAGNSSAQGGNLREALATWERALPIHEANGEMWALRGLLFGIGSAHFQLGAPRKAVAAFERALVVAEALGDKKGVAWSLIRVANLHRDLGAPAVALRFLERSLAAETELGNTRERATRLTEIGSVRAELGEITEALEHHQRSLLLFEQLGDKRGMSVVLGHIGHVHRQLGDRATALSFQKRALGLSQELGDAFGVAATHHSIGNVHLTFGNYAKALREYGHALEAFNKLRHKAGAAASLGSMGSAHEALGDHAKALAYQERALQLFTELDDQTGVASSLSNLGNIHHSLGDFERARSLRMRALALYQKLALKPDVALTLTNIGLAHDERGEYDQALSCFERALKVQEEDLDKPGMAQVFENIGRVNSHRGNHQKALEYLQRALALWEQMKNRANLASALAAIGETKARMGERAEGLEALGRALREARRGRIRPLLVRCLRASARIHLDTGEFDLALAEVQQAVTEVEHLLGRLDEEQGALARARYTEVFEIGTVAAVRAGDPAQAVTFLEGGRAGSLLESLGGRSALRWSDVPEDLRRAESMADAQEARAREEMRKASELGDLRVMQEKANALEAALNRVAQVAARVTREVKGKARVFVYPRAATVEEIQEGLKPHQALVLYGLCLDDALAVVITPKEVRVVSLGTAAAVRKACAALDLSDIDADSMARTAPLREMIVKPLALKKHVTHVLVSPEGPLCYVPFAALLDRIVTFTPSGSTHIMLRDQVGDPGDDVLALGDPDYSGLEEGVQAVYVRGRKLTRLPGTRPEAEAVGDEILLGAKANEGELRRVLGEHEHWRAVHFACHGLLDPERPTLSALALSATSQQDGFLTVREVLRMDLPADLVVLSACDTGRGTIVKGEGIVGWTRAFMYAGAPRVICSLWKVDDEATQALMIKFYELWNPKDGKKGIGCAAALKKAQEFIRDHKDKDGKRHWKHPYYWAAWVLWGLPE